MPIKLKRHLGGLMAALALALCLPPGALAAEIAENDAALGPRNAPELRSGAWERYAQGGSGAAELRLTAPADLPRAGESFTVTVDLTGNPGFSAVQFTLPYDRDAMECTSANPGTLLKGMMAASNPAADTGAIIAAASVYEIQGDGQAAVFTFTAKRDLPSLEFSLINVELANGEDEVLDTTVTQRSTASPVPPQEQRDLEAESEAVIRELEDSGVLPPSSEEAPPESPRDPAPPAESANPAFTDTAGHWAAADIARAAELGLIGGYEDGTFKPDNSLTRAQLVTILYRLAGRPAVSAAAPFTDLGGVNEEFRTAIAWAYGQGLVGGYTPTTFQPQGILSRQAAMKILFQYGGGTAGMEGLFYSTYDAAFPDSGTLPEWAKAPVYWGVYHTLIEAGEGDALTPAAPMTRGQLARAMVRFHDQIGEEGTR